MPGLKTDILKIKKMKFNQWKRKILNLFKNNEIQEGAASSSWRKTQVLMPTSQAWVICFLPKVAKGSSVHSGRVKTPENPLFQRSGGHVYQMIRINIFRALDITQSHLFKETGWISSKNSVLCGI